MTMEEKMDAVKTATDERLLNYFLLVEQRFYGKVTQEDFKEWDMIYTEILRRMKEGKK